MIDIEQAIAIVKRRILYHTDERKYRYELGKDCLDECAKDIVKDLLALCERGKEAFT